MSSSPYPALKRAHARRLRELYRSAGWPYQDVIEIELLAAGLLERVADARGVDCMRVTDAGLAYLAVAAQGNRDALSAHNALVDQVAQALRLQGRLVWTGLSLRARLPTQDSPSTPDLEGSEGSEGSEDRAAEEDGAVQAAGQGAASRWRLCMPDVFSIRNSSKQAYLEPVVHEIKVSRADLLGDLKLPDKRQAYLELGGQCWYVLGCTAKGQAIAEADEVPAECGVMLARGGQLEVLRLAPKRAVVQLPFDVWMALAKAAPVLSSGERAQSPLGEQPNSTD